MKYCPYCGAEILSGAFSFCPECGGSLSVLEESQTSAEAPPAQKQGKEPRPRKPRKSKHPKEEKPRRTFALPPDYDGYYEDVQPIDADRQREGVDTRLILRVVLLVAGVALVIGGCVVALFLL